MWVRRTGVTRGLGWTACSSAHESAWSATCSQPGAAGRRCGPANSFTSVTVSDLYFLALDRWMLGGIR